MPRSRSVSALLFVPLAASCAGRQDTPVPTAPPASAHVGAPQPARELAVHASPARRPRSELADIGTCDEGSAQRGVARFTVAHFNDLQARYNDRIDGRSRYAYLAGYLRGLKASVPSTLVLDAGDDYEKGSLAELRTMGESTRQMIQALPIDVRTIGNHDFAYGEAAVLRDVRLSAHPVLAANVRWDGAASDAEQPFVPFVMVKVGCVRVGVVGLVTQGYGADDQPSREPFCGVFRQDPRYAEELSRQVKAHRAEVDVMIALTHTGLGEDIALAQGVSGVDLVVGAHTEDLLRAPGLAQRADGTRGWVLQAGHYGHTVGRADLVFDPRTRAVSFESYRIVDVDGSLPHDDDVADLAANLERDAEPDLHAVIASVRGEKKPGRDMSDLLFKAVANAWGADALVVGRDVFWEGLPRGPITLDRLYRSVLVQREPAGTSGFTSLYLVDVKGDELLGLRARAGPMYDVYLPTALNPKRTYRVAMEKRAYTYPFLAWAGRASVPGGRFGGEIIDVLERHARMRAAEGLSID